ASGLTGTASTNTGSGYVRFTWSYSPAITTTVTHVGHGDLVTASVTGLPASRAFDVVWDGSTVASLTSDPSGTAAVSFTVASAQRFGTFPLRLSVAGVVVASSTDIQVAAVLAATGSDSTTPAIVAGSAVLAGILLLVGSATVRRRVA